MNKRISDKKKRRYQIVTIIVLIIVVTSFYSIISLNHRMFLRDLQLRNKDNQSDDLNYTLFDNRDTKIVFSDYKNYIEDNLERYLEYKDKNKNMFESEVVWRVNMNKDIEPYTQIMELKNADNYVSIVNENQKVDNNYKPNDLVFLDGYVETFEVRYAVNVMFVKFLDFMENNNYVIQVIRAYDQDSIEYRKGHDEHQLGLAIDVDYESDSNIEAIIDNNLHLFGFIRSESDLKHFRFVSKEIAVDMYEKNIKDLEEYVDKHINTR